MAKVNGTDMTVLTGSDVVLYSKNCTLNIEQDLPDSTTKGSSGWEEHINGVRRWSIDFDGAFDASGTGFTAVEIIDSIIARTSDTTIKFGLEASAGHYYSGSATWKNLSITGAVEDVATYSGSLVGNGALTYG